MLGVAARSRTRGELSWSEIFCPRCGDALIERDGSLACERSDMDLSHALRAGLEAVFVRGDALPAASTQRRAAS
jgi:hypothetical protein